MKTCVIVFSHSNYLIKPTGTEKCIRELADVLLQKDTATIQVFSMYNKFSRVFGDQLIGVNYGKEFIGIYRLGDLTHLITILCKKYILSPIGIHIHHLMNFDLPALQRFMTALPLPTHLFIHDYYTVCTSTNMIDSRGEFCGVSFPSWEKCTHCSYYKNFQQTNLIRNFLERISPSIDRVIVPSLDLFNRWTSVYPEYKEITHVRGHLTPSGRYKRNYTENKKIKVAFVGSQLPLKGYEDWKKVADALGKLDSQYELHYLGTARHKHPNVINHTVSTATGGKDAMTTSLRENDIDFILLWSQCPETYSYAYFEASAAGSVIITNPKSGNVAAMVEKTGNGIVFSNVEQVISFFHENNTASAFLQKFIADPPFAPDHLDTNSDILGLLPLPSNKKTCQLPVIQKKITPLRLHSFLYSRKHKIALCKV